ncbi:mucin-2-like [Penaeus vannamei]|uniref:mucin-2-like n=1 Tax=Penaeus vannamei TaxID=6689 RepID=UPI00387F424D
MRLPHSSDSLTNSNSLGSPTPGSPLTTTEYCNYYPPLNAYFPTPGSPLTKTLNTETTTHSSMPIRSETESIALSNLTDHSGNPIPAELHPTLSTCTGTVSLSPANCPVDTKDWSDCGEDLSGCLKYQDVKSVHCNTIPPKETMDDVQSYMLKTQDPITHAHSTLEVVADIHTSPTNIPPTPLPPTPSQHNLTPSTTHIHPPNTPPPDMLQCFTTTILRAAYTAIPRTSRPYTSKCIKLFGDGSINYKANIPPILHPSSILEILSSLSLSK